MTDPEAEDRRAKGYCPECGEHTWNIRGCNYCGAQPFIPSFDYQDAVLAKTPTTQ